ncbi:MAG: hypothetical protein R3E76_15590 [Planctomycetota bacterium]
MSLDVPVRVTGREVLESVLADSGMNVAHTNLRDVRTHAPRFFEQLRRGEPNIVVIGADRVESLDVMSLRWMFPAGITPLVLCPSNPQECAELAEAAISAATLIPGPVFLLLEDAVGDAEDIVIAHEAPELELVEPAPGDLLDVPQDEGELRMLDARLRSGFKGLEPAILDPCPKILGKPEWLLVSFGSSTVPGRLAVESARNEGQRVNHLSLRQLWPLPENALMRAVMGIKHIVVAERNLGQYATEVRRFAPDITVIPAGGISQVTPDAILARLQRTPRCC